MKNIILAFILLVATCVQSKTPILTALQQKRISVSMKYHAFGENAFTMKIINLTSETLDLVIPSGMIFVPEDEGEQTLMKVEDDFIVLKDHESTEKKVDGYCTMYHHAAPSTNRDFSLGMTEHPNLKKLLGFLKDNKVSRENYQAAIWAVSDNNDIAEIKPLTENDKNLREFIGQMTNRKNPWYTKPTELQIIPGQSIVKRAVAIEGVIEVFADHDYDVYVTVDKSNGERKFKLKNMTLTKNSDNKFTFKVKATGWEVGDYKVVVRRVSDNREVKSFKFTV